MFSADSTVSWHTSKSRLKSGLGHCSQLTRTTWFPVKKLVPSGPYMHRLLDVNVTSLRS